MDNFADIADFLRPRLRLFLSVDLVGSTSFKQSGSLPVRAPGPDDLLGTLGAQWFDPIAQFYGRIESIFSDEWERYCKQVAPACQWPIPEAGPELWKANGDELIYVLEIKSHHDAYAAVTAWMRTVRAYRAILQSEHHNLDLKAAAWTAGFPIGNVEVVFRRQVKTLDPDDPEKRYGFHQARLLHYLRLQQWYAERTKTGYGESSGLVKDYIGPSMDLGFRIAGKATPRKFAITADLALLLVTQPPSSETKKKPPVDFFQPIEVRYDGGVELKGVLSGKPYPFFWVNMLHDDSLLEAEDKLLPNNKCSETFLIEFCNEFFFRHQKHLLRPFIVGCAAPELVAPPTNYADHLRRIDALWSMEKKRYDDEERGIGEEDDEGETVAVDSKDAADIAGQMPPPAA